MKKKTLIISVILLLAVVAIFTLGVTAPPESVERAGISGSTVDLDSESKQVSSTAPYNKEASTFNFEGFGPGKSHLATFDEITINIEKDKVLVEEFNCDKHLKPYRKNTEGYFLDNKGKGVKRCKV